MAAGGEYSYNSREVNFTSTSDQMPRGRYGTTYTNGMDEVPLMASDMDGGFETDESDYLFTPKGRGANKKRGVGYYLTSGWKNACSNCCDSCLDKCKRKKELKPRSLWIGKTHTATKYPSNAIRNQKYNVFTFIPCVLYEQFKFFLNFYFLVMACSQFIQEIRVGYLYTYWGPLTFVIFVTMCREAVDDIRRWKRDREINNQKYTKLTIRGQQQLASSKIKVGDLILIDKDQRVPADMVLLRTTEKNGACFVRTDQLDGETDWKLRLAVPATQQLGSNVEVFDISAQLFAEKPQKDIHSFIGTFTRNDVNGVEEGLSIENTLWANTVVASGTALGVVIYTGRETRSVMNTSKPHMKVGLLDMEVNEMTKVLFFMVLALAVVMMCLKGFGGPWYRYLFRFIVLFSYIIPISLRVNLDMGKVAYSWFITRDDAIPNTVVRSTTIPEELGRINYLLTDKTGTLTQNEMVFKRLHLGTVSFSPDTMDDVVDHLRTSYAPVADDKPSPGARGPPRVRRTVVTRVFEAVRALALCHNVTPVYEDSQQDADTDSDIEADQQSQQEVRNYFIIGQWIE